MGYLHAGHLSLVQRARQLVGIPTGIARMDYRLFSVFTVLGAIELPLVMAVDGAALGGIERLDRFDLD